MSSTRSDFVRFPAQEPVETPAVPSLEDAARDSAAVFSMRSYADGRKRLRRARAADPLNPVHLLRTALFEMRFGQWDEAIATVDSLLRIAPHDAARVPQPTYLRSLAMLRLGEPKRAENVLKPLLSGAAPFVPAPFLNAEIQAQVKIKSIAKLLPQLPRDDATAALWIDLLAKLLLAHGKDGAAATTDFLRRFKPAPDGSPEAAMLARLTELRAADLDQLETLLAADRAGSRAEELTLLVYHDRLQELPEPKAALSRLSRLQRRYPERRAVARLYVAFTARLAVAEARQERFLESLALVEHCQALEPWEPIHYQNRAALFTLLKELDAYHEAWASLNRHLYRLALLGRLSEADSLRLMKFHRLFAQQSRLTRDDAASGQRNAGIFRTESTPGVKDRPRLLVNQPRIEQDAEQLRQWIYHRQAELCFQHWRLGADPYRFLLHPSDALVAQARLRALERFAQALEVMAAEEGSLLAEQLVGQWRRRCEASGSHYAAAPDDADVQRILAEHLETMSDLALLCLGWRGAGMRPELVEAVLAFIPAAFAFFSDAAVYEAIKRSDREGPDAIGTLYGFINELFNLDGLEPPLSDEQVARIPKALESALLRGLAYSVYNESKQNPRAADKALAFIDRARSGGIEDPALELAAAQFLAIGEYFDEARRAVSRFYRYDGQRDRDLATQMEEIQEVLEEKRKKSEAGRQRTDAAPESEPVRSGDDLPDLLQELADRPSSIQTYEQVVHRYIGLNQFDTAIAWSERAVAKCLSRRSQVRARALNLEAIGLRDLAAIDSAPVELYLRGVHHPALKTLSAQPAGQSLSYALLYVQGRCQMAVGAAQEATASFAAAMAACDRPLHRPMLRRLSTNLDETYIEFVRQRVGDLAAAGNFQDALKEIISMTGQLQKPEFALAELAGLLLRRAVATLEGAGEPGGAPSLSVNAGWNDRLAAALALDTDLRRAIALAELSREVCEATRAEADALVRKCELYQRQVDLGAILARSAAHLDRAEFAAALAALDEITSNAEQPRVLRQRATILLRLERFDEAREVVERLRQSDTELAREFVERYPSLDLQKRLQLVGRLLRDGDAGGAIALLEAAEARSAEEVLEWTYQLAFAYALDGYRLRRQGSEDESRRQLAHALHLVESRIPQARAAGHARMAQLYEKLDKDLDESQS